MLPQNSHITAMILNFELRSSISNIMYLCVYELHQYKFWRDCFEWYICYHHKVIEYSQILSLYI